MRRVLVPALVLALFVGCGEVDLGEGRDAGAGGSAGDSGAKTNGGSAGLDAATTGGSAGLDAGTTGGSGGSAGLGGSPPTDASDGAVPEAGWFSCSGDFASTACECDGTTHYCAHYSGGGALIPPPPDAAVCEQDGGSFGCLPLPAGCGRSCDCVMKSAPGGVCSCTESSGNVEVFCQGVCASPDTPIDTPSGPRAIAELRPGDLVYSVDKGRVAAVPIRRVQRIEVRAHSVVHVELASGSTLEISAPHPTADGRDFGDLAAGDELDGVRILRVECVPYTFDATYDILPDSDTGTYFAGGVLIGSTMAPPPAVPLCASVQ